MKIQQETLPAIVLVLLIPWATVSSNEPSATVSRFCELDGKAARLTASADSSKLWNLTVGDEEPPSEPIVVVSSYTIQPGKIRSNTGWVEVRYHTIGVLESAESGFSFIKQPEVKVIRFKLKRTAAGWKILRSSLSSPPYVTRNGIREYFNRLIAERRVDDQQERNLVNILDQLKLDQHARP